MLDFMFATPKRHILGRNRMFWRILFGALTYVRNVNCIYQLIQSPQFSESLLISDYSGHLFFFSYYAVVALKLHLQKGTLRNAKLRTGILRNALRNGGVLQSIESTMCLKKRANCGKLYFRQAWTNFDKFVLTRDIDIANMSVCPSVCLSVCPSVRNVPVSDENGLTYRHSLFTIRQPNHSSYASIKHLHEIPTGSPPAGALNTGGV